jgi:hypothetical protein
LDAARGGARRCGWSAGVVDPGVEMRVGDESGEPGQRDRRRREHVADSGREGERSSGVAGGKQVEDGICK